MNWNLPWNAFFRGEYVFAVHPTRFEKSKESNSVILEVILFAMQNTNLKIKMIFWGLY
jgi:hypothetical protein